MTKVRVDLSEKIIHAFRTFAEFHRELFLSRYRREALRELRDTDDFFLFITLSEQMGVSSPVFYYTLELYPYLLEYYHDWHRRMGMDHSPLDRFGCC